MKTMHMDMNMHWSFACNNKKTETIQLFISREWLINCVYPSNEILLSTKKHELLIKATLRVNLRRIMLSQRGQTKSVHSVWFYFYKNSKKWKLSFDVRKWIRHCLGTGRGCKERLQRGVRKFWVYWICSLFFISDYFTGKYILEIIKFLLQVCMF